MTGIQRENKHAKKNWLLKFRRLEEWQEIRGKKPIIQMSDGQEAYLKFWRQKFWEQGVTAKNQSDSKKKWLWIASK